MQFLPKKDRDTNSRCLENILKFSGVRITRKQWAVVGTQIMSSMLDVTPESGSSGSYGSPESRCGAVFFAKTSLHRITMWSMNSLIFGSRCFLCG
jgi:hypothetical protein